MKKGIYLIFKLKTLVFAVFLTLTVILFAAVVKFSYASQVSSNLELQQGSATVIIDAGHGGEDGGTQSEDGILEKDINLAVSLKIKAILDSLGINNELVRNADCLIYDNPDVPMRQRKVSDIHNRLKIVESADNGILLSIHQNYFAQSKYSGTQVFYSPNNPLSREIAETIQHTVVKNIQTKNTRKIKQSGKEIYLLYHCKAPAVMVECGFLSNPQESKKLNSDEYQLKIAFSVCEGISDFV